MPKQYEIPWSPQPRQADLLAACGLLPVLAGGMPERPVADLIGYGGAAYGGKSDGLLGVGAIAALVFPGCRIGFFRRTYPELEGPGGAIDRSHDIFGSIGEYNHSSHEWTFFTGSKLRFSHVQHARDRYKYKSQQFDILLIDEATSFTWEIIDYVLTRNRATVQGVVPFAAMCSNPGDIGHWWYKQVFVDGPHEKVKRQQLPSGTYDRVVFIPAFISDNLIGLQRDPEYADRLRRREPILADQLLAGNWDAFQGQAFPEWRRDRHVITPRSLPDLFPRWRAVDWGFVHPFYCIWLARDPDNGRVYAYREVSRIELTDRQQARLIYELTPPDEGITITYADPSMWTVKTYEDKVLSTADEYEANGIQLTRADNDRVGGKRKVHQALADLPDGKPGLLVFENCQELIRCMPLMVLSQVRPEDAEKVDGDDPYDGVRYGLTNVKIYTSPADQRARKKARSESPLVGVKGL